MIRPGAPSRRVQRFWRDARGTIAIKFAMALPAIALVALGAIDLNAVQSDRSRLQDIADAAALAGGRELALAIDEEGPIQRAESFIQGHLDDWEGAPAVEPDVKMVTLAGQQRALKVDLVGNRPSFFGNLLPPGGWTLKASATASPVSIAPLCVLAHGTRQNEGLKLSDASRIEAPVCLLHANRSVEVAPLAAIRAATTQAVGRATGNIQRAPQDGAPAMEDPYLTLDPRPPGGCNPRNRKRVDVRKNTTLQPGLHCDDYYVRRDAVLTLAAGEHYFVGSRLALTATSRLAGDDVVMIFDQAAFDFIDRSRVNLSGRRTGPLAGFVMIGLRPPLGWCPLGRPPSDDDDDDDDGGLVGGLVGGLLELTQAVLSDLLDAIRPANCLLGSEFRMASDNVESLDGVIYFPQSKLIVQGFDRIAEASDWTVMVVEDLQIRGSPTLVINADYAGAVVPVPAGVGPQGGAVNLVD
jgi:hypothetical protein